MSTIHFSLNTALKSLRESEVEWIKTKTHSNTLKKYNLTDDQVVATDESGSDSDGGSSSSSFSSLGANDNCHQESHQPQEEVGEVVILALLAIEAELFFMCFLQLQRQRLYCTRRCSFWNNVQLKVTCSGLDPSSVYRAPQHPQVNCFCSRVQNPGPEKVAGCFNQDCIFWDKLIVV